MACSSCYNNPSPCPSCGCDTTPVPNPEPIPIVCPDPEPCDYAIDSKCVIYTGGDLPCIGIEAGSPPIIRLDEVLEKLDAAVCDSALAVTFVESTDCISLSGDGSSLNPVTATPIISNDPDNVLECTPDGLQVIIPTDVLTGIVISDTNCVNLSGNGTTATPLSAALTLDPTSSNLLQCTVAGLKATVTAEGSDCISVTGTGTASSPLVVDTILNEDADNILSCEVDGLKAVVNIASTGCIIGDGVGTLAEPLMFSLLLDPAFSGLKCDEDGLAINFDFVEVPLTFTNGLTRTLNVVELGGTLSKNTSIDLNTFGLLFYDNNDNYFDILSTGFISQYTNGGGTTPFSRLLHDSDKFVVNSGAYADISSGAFINSAFANFDFTNSKVTIGSKVPYGAVSALQSTSYFETEPFSLITSSYEINNITPSTSITSGALEAGVEYVITVSSGGANFVPSGSLNNTVGTVFTSNGVTPYWGTGAVQLYGKVRQTSGFGATLLDRRNYIINITKDTTLGSISNSTDLGNITIHSSGYYETQLYSAYQRSLVAYHAEASLVLKNTGSTTQHKYAQLGVNIPTSNDGAIGAPDYISTTAFTQWISHYSAELGTDYGVMINNNVYTSFIGLTEASTGDPVVNDGYTKVGVNITVNNLLTSNASLVIDGPSGVAPLNIKRTHVPATAADPGIKGDISWGNDGANDYIYVCVATNSWKRASLASW